jgi:threonine aldolase
MPYKFPPANPAFPLVRLVTSFATQRPEVEQFVSLVKAG